MSSVRETKSRPEISEAVRQTRDQMAEKTEEIQVTVEDVDVTRDTQNNLSREGTTEGAAETESALEGAESTAVDTFEEKDQALDEIQQEGQDYQVDLEGRMNSSEGDLESVGEAKDRIETPEVADRMAEAEQAVQGDIDFLKEQINRAQADLEESEQAQEDFESHVRAVEE